jgi:hypothetical protein
LFIVVAKIFDQLLLCREFHLLLCCAYYLQGGGVDTLKFNLHIIKHVKKGCEFTKKGVNLKMSFIYELTHNMINQISL